MIGEVALQALPGQISGGSTQAMSGHFREAPTPQVTWHHRNPLARRGFCVSELLRDVGDGLARSKQLAGVGASQIMVSDVP